MRIVAGQWAGLQLLSPGQRVRPTMEPLRDACMRHLGAELKGARVLDLFAGTGSLGLEALSRGAQTCDFVEDGSMALHALKANVAKVKARERTRIFKRDAIPFAEGLSAAAYDIAFVDPPYGSRKLDRVVARWIAVPFARILVLEHAADQPPGVAGAQIRIDDSVVTIAHARVASGGPDVRTPRGA